MQSLIERFQDLIEPIHAPLGDIEEGRTADGGADAEQGERAQRSLALQQATQRVTQNTMALQKLRSHFQKVRSSAQLSASAAAAAFLPASSRGVVLMHVLLQHDARGLVARTW